MSNFAGYDAWLERPYADRAEQEEPEPVCRICGDEEPCYKCEEEELVDGMVAARSLYESTCAEKFKTDCDGHRSEILKRLAFGRNAEALLKNALEYGGGELPRTLRSHIVALLGIDEESHSGTAGDRVKELRQRKNLTLQDVANQTGLSKGFLSDIENNKRQTSTNTLLKLATAFDVSMDYLARGDK